MKIPTANAKGHWPMHPLIEDVCALQTALGRQDTHIVWVGPPGSKFVMAHTDQERAELATLEECELHQWCRSLDGPPVVAGYYAVTAVPHDPTSESFRSDAMPYSFEPVAVPQ